eukprot:scaffold22.g6154.t1
MAQDTPELLINATPTPAPAPADALASLDAPATALPAADTDAAGAPPSPPLPSPSPPPADGAGGPSVADVLSSVIPVPAARKAPAAPAMPSPPSGKAGAAAVEAGAAPTAFGVTLSFVVNMPTFQLSQYNSNSEFEGLVAAAELYTGRSPAIEVGAGAPLGAGGTVVPVLLRYPADALADAAGYGAVLLAGLAATALPPKMQPFSVGNATLGGVTGLTLSLWATTPGATSAAPAPAAQTAALEAALGVAQQYGVRAPSVSLETLKGVPNLRVAISVGGADVAALVALQAALQSASPPQLLGGAPLAPAVLSNFSYSTNWTALPYQISPDAATKVADRRFGTYRSEERTLWEAIYAPNATLAPLNMVSNRFQISLGDDTVARNGTWTDPERTQLGVLKATAAAVSSEIFITVGFPWTNTSRYYITAGFPPGWWTVWSTLADALASDEYRVDRTVYIELLGEPDLFIWSWIYGQDRFRVYQTIWLARSAFARYPGRFVLGTAGFAMLEDSWVSGFLGEGACGFHTYLGWNDAYDISTYPSMGPAYELRAILGRLQTMLAAHGIVAPIVLSEYAWWDGDMEASAGFGAPSKSARDSIVGYRNAARTLEAIDIVVAEPAIARAYWAQGVGSFYVDPNGMPKWPYIYTYNPSVVYVAETDSYHYKSSYYAFWMYGRLTGVSAAVGVADPLVGVWSGVTPADGVLRVVLWNRSPAGRTVALALPSVPVTAPARLYRVDADTFQLSCAGADAPICGPTSPAPPLEASVATAADALAFLRDRGLGGEAAAMLEVTLSPQAASAAVAAPPGKAGAAAAAPAVTHKFGF